MLSAEGHRHPYLEELRVGAAGEVESSTRTFLKGFEVIGLDETIAERAVDVRRRHRIKLPDSIIWATTQIHAPLLTTRNTKDLPPTIQAFACLTNCRKGAS